MTLPLLLVGITGLLSETLSSLSLEAKVGENVTIWCRHNLAVADRIFWFKHTCDSVPLLLGCKQFYTLSPSEQCYFFTGSNRTVMSINSSNTTLTITAVNVSDTGLYYCSITDRIIFSNATYLHVKENKTLTPSSDGAKGSLSPAVPFMPNVFFTLTVVFSAVSVILLCVLIFIKQECDSVNYAALQFSKKKVKKMERFSKTMDPHVVYSDIRE